MQPTRDSPPNFTNSSSSSISKTTLIKMWAEDLSRNFSKAKTQTAKRHTRRLSTSRIPREVQIKTTMSLCITPVGMVIVKNSTNNKCWRGYGVKGTSYAVVDNIKIELPYDPAIPLLRLHPGKGLKGYMLPNDHCHAVYISQDIEAT